MIDDNNNNINNNNNIINNNNNNNGTKFEINWDLFFIYKINFFEWFKWPSILSFKLLSLSLITILYILKKILFIKSNITIVCKKQMKYFVLTTQNIQIVYYIIWISL